MKIFKWIISLIIILSLFTIYGFCVDPNFAKVDATGNRILEIIRNIAYWVILVSCIVDIIKCAMARDLNKLGKTIMMYVIIYGSLFFVPVLMKMVEGIF